MSQKFDIAVIIGRFQIPHQGHQQLIQEAARVADRVVILVGSAHQAKTPKNPFSFTERKAMLEANISNYVNYTILPVRDQQYNLQHWLVDVANKVNSTIVGWSDKPPSTVLVGHKKDHSSSYLDMFPQWNFHEIGNHENISSTHIRDALFDGVKPIDIEYLNPATIKYLNTWILTPDFDKLRDEYSFIKKYKTAWESAPYAPTFVTVDAVVIQSGHILLVKRKASPGKGLYALPGGFINQYETLEDAVIRELCEETKIKLQDIILRRSITSRKVYDDPSRSLRGRTITHAFLIELEAVKLPRVRGADDAEKAIWLPINEVFSMGAQMYEDHLSIIMDITGSR